MSVILKQGNLAPLDANAALLFKSKQTELSSSDLHYMRMHCTRGFTRQLGSAGGAASLEAKLPDGCVSSTPSSAPRPAGACLTPSACNGCGGAGRHSFW